MELTYYHQKVNVRVDELPNDLRQIKSNLSPRYFRRWGGLCAHTRKKINELKKISKMSTKKQILTVVLKNFEESAVKNFIENFLLYFTYFHEFIYNILFQDCIQLV